MTCAKKKVVCILVTADGEHSFSGTNNCANPQEVCPRKEGEGYEKCKSICNQPGHAEEVALKKAQETGVSLCNATAHVSGIDNFCKSCQRKMYEAGIRTLRFIS